MRIQEREALLASAFPASTSSPRHRWSCSKNSLYLIGTLALLGIISISVMMINNHPHHQNPFHQEATSSSRPSYDDDEDMLLSNITRQHHKDDYIPQKRTAAANPSSGRRQTEPNNYKRHPSRSYGQPAAVVLPLKLQKEQEDTTSTFIPPQTPPSSSADAADTDDAAATNPPTHYTFFLHDLLCGGCKMIPVDNSETATCDDLITQLMHEWAGLTYERAAKHVVKQHAECHICLQCTEQPPV